MRDLLAGQVAVKTAQWREIISFRNRSPAPTCQEAPGSGLSTGQERGTIRPIRNLAIGPIRNSAIGPIRNSAIGPIRNFTIRPARNLERSMGLKPDTRLGGTRWA